MTANLPGPLAGLTQALPQDAAAMNSLMNAIGQQGRAAGGIGPGQARGTPFAKFSGNDGSFTYGKNGQPIPETQKFIAPVQGITHGLKFWDQKRVTEELIVSATEPFPEKPDNRPWAEGNVRTGWGKEYGLLLCGYKGPLANINFRFTGGSLGMEKFWGDVLVAIQQNWMSNPEAKNGLIHPIISVGSRSYEHTDYNRMVYEPALILHGFTDGHREVESQIAIGDQKTEDADVEDVLG